jgi:hypothetical protein
MSERRQNEALRFADFEYPQDPGYAKWPTDDGYDAWMVMTPDRCLFMLANPGSNIGGAVHEVEEHEDGTITVEPRPGNSNSILSPKGWHGYIDHGVWRAA